MSLFQRCPSCQKSLPSNRFVGSEGVCDSCSDEPHSIIITADKKACEVCGEEFTPVHSNHRYCSDECYAADSPARYQWREKVECEGCGTLFTKEYWNQRYCTTDCRDIHYQEPNSNGRGRFIILERDKFRCFYCGVTSYGDNVELHVDHVVPRSEGGKDIASNLATACAECNQQKGDTRLLPDTEEQVLSEVERRNEEQEIPSKVTIKL